MKNPELELKPTYVQGLFLFEDVSQIPDHYEAWPFVPNFVGQWAVFNWSGPESNNTPKLALDIISGEQAELLAIAARDKAESDIDIFRHTLDIYILDPNGNHTRFYIGRKIR